MFYKWAFKTKGNLQIYGIAKLKKHGRWIDKRTARGLQGSVYPFQPGNGESCTDIGISNVI